MKAACCLVSRDFTRSGIRCALPVLFDNDISTSSSKPSPVPKSTAGFHHHPHATPSTGNQRSIVCDALSPSLPCSSSCFFAAVLNSPFNVAWRFAGFILQIKIPSLCSLMTVMLRIRSFSDTLAGDCRMQFLHFKENT